ncbi:MAG: MerC domain-containing protein [Planctomycetota bacterium]
MNNELSIIDSDAVGASLLSHASGPAAFGRWSDGVGMAASIGCAIHCAAMPFVIAYLPAFGLSFLADEAFHKWMAVGCFVIALIAFVPGLRRHGRSTPVIVGSVGLAMISVAAFGFAGECCPSCVGSSTPAASASNAACADAGCQHCPSESFAASPIPAEPSSASLAASTTSPSPWSARIVAWLTPLGGVVLVSAHLLNRRYGCLSGCCSAESSAAEGSIG